jgi:hypothetical protein
LTYVNAFSQMKPPGPLFGTLANGPASTWRVW